MGGDRRPLNAQVLDEQDWELMAEVWDEEIFDTLANDQRRAILKELRKVAGQERRVADFGCGVGKYVPMLSSLFGEVHGFDQSAACIKRARHRVKRLGNVSLHLARRPARAYRRSFDVSVCVNAAIHPHRAQWRGVLRAAAGLVRPGGWLLAVVPSIESACLIARAKVWSDDEGYCVIQGDRGLASFAGVLTKHFAYAELREVARDVGAATCQVRRVEYSWASHGIDARRLRTKRQPWDWLAISRMGN